MASRRPLIILTGPTAAGKTDLSISLAKCIGGEIISADSMQVYKYMDIGTAKIRPEEMQGIRHYLVDELEPDEPFNVVVFQERAKAAMEEIYSRNHIPIIVGGTGFYIQAVLNDIDFSENDDDQTYRHALEAIAETEEGRAKLYEELQKVDPASCEKIHANNIKKVIRALEFYRQTGQPISAHNAKQAEKASPYNFAYIVLTRPRDLLYKRIELRIDQMLEEGLIEEVRKLKAMGYDRSLVSMQGLGYKEILAYLEDEITFDEAIYILKRDTRRFAKRQLTWFRREKETIWFDRNAYSDNEALLAELLTLLEKKEIVHKKDIDL